MLLNESGLELERWDRELLRVLGEGSGEEGFNVLSEATGRGCSKVEVRHWLYCLVKAPAGLLRRQLIDPTGKQPEQFIDIVEDCIGAQEVHGGLPPVKLTVDVIAQDGITMLDAAERLATEHNRSVVNEATLTLAILESGGGALTSILESWATEEGLKRCKAVAKARIRGHLEKITREDLFSTHLLGPRDVENWPSLCARLLEAAGDAQPSPGRRIWGLLDHPSRDAIQEAVGTKGVDPVTGAIRSAVNAVLKRKDFYRAEDFDNTIIDGGAPEPSTINGLSEGERLKLNRRLLEAAYPDVIARAGSADGKLTSALFDPTGHRFCQRFREDMASLGAKQVTTYPMLYTLLGTDSLLARALAIRGVDVKKDLHTALSRQLAKPGAKRNTDFELTLDRMLGPVVDVLVHATELARASGAVVISEADISRAFVHRSAKTLQEMFPKDKPLELSGLRDYLDSAEVEVEEDEKAGERLTVARIEEAINTRIRGQGQALAKVIPWIKRLRFGLSRDNRPAAVLLFLGPTGTGKTQMAKELARYVYGSEEQLIFLEMGQFQTKESMSGFVGAPPGYVGYGDGKLTNGLRDKPECVVLFDEIEKAYVEVFNALLRFADEGLISDPAGPVRDGSKCIVVMTTNAGQMWLQQEYLKTNELKKTPGELATRLADARADESLADRLLDAARKELQQRGFRPEFIGRVDELVTFLPLDLDTCQRIAADILTAEQKKLLDLKDIELKWDDEALQILAEKAMVRSLAEGARGVPRTINEHVVGRIIDAVVLLEEEGKACRTLRVFRGPGIEQVEVEAG